MGIIIHQQQGWPGKLGLNGHFNEKIIHKYGLQDMNTRNRE
jgi:hypothetical protein